MNKHLPECCVGTDDCKAEPCQRCHACCICEQLRACEQRVARTREGNGELWLDGYGTGWQDGHTFALDAAREAVAGVLHWSEGELGLICNWNSACDAIDALKEQR